MSTLTIEDDRFSVFHSPDVVDLCAGPGGWDEGVRHLGIRPLGIEIDEIASETATLAGHARVVADISALNPKVYMGARGLIASPPCQGFSMAGKGDGRRDAELLLRVLREEFVIDPDRAIASLHYRMHDDRSVLVLEPLRWALALLPEWMAWEQVPAVLPIWEACADVLMTLGYTVETGICSSEEYGVPQTRERAILVARSPEMTARLGPAKLAPATHSYYHRRNPTKLDEGVLPWVSMAQALSWGMTERPYFTVAAGSANGGADAAMLGGTGARASLDREIQAGRWKQRSNYSGPGKPGETAAERGLGTRELDQPSFAITSKAFHFVPTEDDVEIETVLDSTDPELVVRTGNFTAQKRDADGERSSAGSVPFERSVDAPAPTVTGNVGAWEVGESERDVEFIQGNQSKATRRTLDQPAPTITGGNDYGSRRWQMASAGPTARFTSGQVPRDLDQPAATITGKGTAYWTPEGLTRDEAPRGTLLEPDYRDAQEAKSVRVTVDEAAVLQSFPWGYPWQGNKGDRYRQVGDAVPPLMAMRIVEAVTSLDSRS